MVSRYQTSSSRRGAKLRNHDIRRCGCCVKILFDQGTPVPLRQHLGGHTVTTAYEQSWSNLANGKLLDAAEQAGYQLLITTDQNLQHQQQLAGRQLAILVLRSTSWP